MSGIKIFKPGEHTILYTRAYMMCTYMKHIMYIIIIVFNLFELSVFFFFFDYFFTNTTEYVHMEII